MNPVDLDMPSPRVPNIGITEDLALVDSDMPSQSAQVILPSPEKIKTCTDIHQESIADTIRAAAKLLRN